ncbi:anti-sigma B factor antagonist/stage II sporulation protein AA (anti-sigma F factor antagonist) [Streptosporangium becharense]|uniref:Anti-sigma factor antagonist n=1 Tax=Streptosporangium becharense TaxID=1816182 RepID=A0A7W9IHH4_9ACTN|nr:STAS domain-containing protein [Streptosporangium becharense]MBB2914803.1 anti-sigma B factor antagonist/stage II sporulation protein AA (anti-sigma F factor antagonist) [Streptosporangium becharense]MBB5820386.1 anti-sigma B factor antagonist/stage II sporulation protein AA (anti-sigma F factor antagonist) [Streptosporangium becharense]
MSTAVHVTRVLEPVVENTVLLALAGELDYDNATRFDHDTHEAIAEHHGDVVIDLTDLSFCDSTGMQILLKVRRAVHDRGGRLILVNPHSRVARLLHLTGLIQAFEVRPTLAEAAEALHAT